MRYTVIFSDFVIRWSLLSFVTFQIFCLIVMQPYTSYAQERKQPVGSFSISKRSVDQSGRSIYNNPGSNRKAAGRRYPETSEGLMIDGRSVRPGSPRYDKAHEEIWKREQRRNYIPGFDYVGRHEGRRLFRDPTSGIVFLDNTSDNRPYVRGKPETVHIYENGRIILIRQTDQRYAHIERIHRSFVRQKHRWGEGRRAILQDSSNQESSRSRKLLGKLGEFAKKGWFVKIAAFGTSLLTMLKNGTLEAKELSNNAADALSGFFEGDGVINSDAPISDYLDTLKGLVENLSPTSPDFSRLRPHLKSELDEMYNTISNDSSLEQEEKTILLSKVREIQIALPPPNLSPARESRGSRRRSGGSRGIN